MAAALVTGYSPSVMIKTEESSKMLNWHRLVRFLGALRKLDYICFLWTIHTFQLHFIGMLMRPECCENENETSETK